MYKGMGGLKGNWEGGGGRRVGGLSSQKIQIAKLFVQQLTETATVGLDHSTSWGGH